MRTHPSTDEEPIPPSLLDRVRQRDEAAARELVDRLYPLVLRIVRSHRPRNLSEEDLCQEVYMNLFSSLEQYRGNVPLPHWVSRIAVNTCIDHLRKQRVRPELRWADLGENEAEALQAMQADHSAPRPGHAFAVSELVGRLIGALPPEDRQIIQWMELEDLPIKEVSARTGWSLAMVKVRAFRARLRMRRELERLLAQEKS